MIAAAAGAAAAGAAGLAYAAGYEVHAFRLRRVEVPVLAPGSAPLRVLHLSDLHLTPSQHRKLAWLESLAQLEPDLVINTGDNIAHAESVPTLVDVLGPLLARPGAFVFGSNDYYGPTPKNPARYLAPVGRTRRIVGRGLPVEALREGLASKGWVDLGNARTVLETGGRRVELVGTDDPHIGRDRYDVVAGRAGTGQARAGGAGVDLALGVVHAPYHRVVDRMVSDGFSLVLAGHTHGGQLCLPGIGALVTNCDLDRRRAKGLSRHVVATPDGTATGWLHVSAGLGTSPYAPVRFACPPEATLLTLLPSPAP